MLHALQMIGSSPKMHSAGEKGEDFKYVYLIWDSVSISFFWSRLFAKLATNQRMTRIVEENAKHSPAFQPRKANMVCGWKHFYLCIFFEINVWILWYYEIFIWCKIHHFFCKILYIKVSSGIQTTPPISPHLGSRVGWKFRGIGGNLFLMPQILRHHMNRF